MATFRLGTISSGSTEIPVVQIDGQIYRLSQVLGAGSETVLPSILALIERWDDYLPMLRTAVERLDCKTQPFDLSSGAFLSPITRPRKIICIGINYHDHIKEMGVEKLPRFPYAFLRPATSLTGHGATIALPHGPGFIDWEAELGVVIGRKCHGIRAADAPAVVAGYTVVNDLSARDWIEERPFVGIDWVMQKAWDSFQPTGPWLTPAEFLPDVQSLGIELTVNGVVMQQSNTSQMIFGIGAIIEHLSAIMTLEPGDIIATGTPAGVGFGRSPRERLRPGDLVRITIEGLGTLENRIG